MLKIKYILAGIMLSFPLTALNFINGTGITLKTVNITSEPSGKFSINKTISNMEPNLENKLSLPLFDEIRAIIKHLKQGEKASINVTATTSQFRDQIFNLPKCVQI